MGDDYLKIPPGPSHGGDIEAQVRALNDHVHHAMVAWRGLNNLLATIRTSVNDLEHNDLEGLQGGTTGEYYHLTAAQLALLVSLASLTIPVPIANGGTGQTTQTAAFDVLSPLTTRGDMIVRSASNNVRLAKGTARQYLKSDGTDPGWADLPIFETVEFYASNATARNTALRGAVNTTDNNLAFKVPSGKTMKVLACRGRFRAGASAGTTSVAVIIYNVTDATSVKLATGTGTAGTDIYVSGAGTLGTPLGTLAADKLYLIGWFNENSSPGALDATEKHHVSVTFVME